MSAAASREIPMTKQVIDSLATLGEAKKIFIAILEGFTWLLLVLVVASIVIVFVATIVEYKYYVQ